MAFFYPPNFFQQLEFDKILQDLRKRCSGIPARKQFDQLEIYEDALIIRNKLEEVLCFQETMQDTNRIHVSEYHDVSPSLELLEIRDSVLEIEDLLELRHQLDMVAGWFDFFSKDKRIRWKPLYYVLTQTEPVPTVRKHFYQIFDQEGNIKSSASTELAKIRKDLQSKSAALDHAFNRALSFYKDKNFLTDNFESYRNGRRVLAVLAEYKRKIKGIIHDESSTGKTVFMQPEETLALDSELFELQNEERREIRKILKLLCQDLHQHLHIIRANFQVVVEFDIIQAKALQAIALGIHSMPKCTESPSFEWHRAYHPLLLLKHQADRHSVIPFNLEINDRQRIIVISGPNAGGKSITLKAVGLLCLMHQSALLTPVDDQSTMGVFKQILTDIGDQQSIEEDLSTYTSHLQNMKVFTEKSNVQTLFLIDEFGSGTEPTIGAAIAESILQRLHHLKARGIITTHYGNLKILASKTEGMENASMAFDREALQPTFALHVGSPGSSFAFEMAKRSGLHEKIVQNARHKMGKKEGRLDYLLTNLQKEKNDLDKKLRDLEQQKDDLDKLVKNYERMSNDLQVRRKKLKLDEKNLQLQEQTRANKDLEKIIREIRENQNLDKAKKLSAELKKERSVLETDTQEIHQEILEKSVVSKIQKPFEIGDYVRMKIGDMVGVIDNIQKNKITVLTGNITLNVKPSDIEHSRPPIDIQAEKSINTRMQLTEEVHQKIDIRGLRKDEALLRLENFIDKALIANLHFLEVIHGKGNGILKTVVRDKLQEYNIAFEISHPEPEQGGDGVTLIKL
ncbi:MAG: Smr/MutS family protein [Saprospiraceae bacterium]|nr:Smr/MutS family protein [Saprospiraceae bacterium]